MRTRRRHSRTACGRNNRRRDVRLQLEQLEQRDLLAADPWMWFESFADVPRIPITKLAADVAPQTHESIGPHELIESEWVVRLSDAKAESIQSLNQINEILDLYPINFTVVSGLGSPGLVLLRCQSVTLEDAQFTLRSSDHVVYASPNSVVQGESLPSDPDLVSGAMPGLDLIGTESAWDASIGSSSMVVGVVDGGIDLDHPDLFLNIWLNQGEIPRDLLDGDPDIMGDELVDIDNDGLITFYDLNNLIRTDTGLVVASTGSPTTIEQLTTATPYASGANAGFVGDLNQNGRIDALDLIDDVDWADGRDTDGNSFFDDLVGVNFRSGGNDPFADNVPDDQLGHGTHVAGTVGAVGDNGFGVTGVNWQTSLMSLRILDNLNQADAAAAIRAINYAKQMRQDLRSSEGRTRSGANVRVLNNSWGQPGGFEQVFQDSISQLGEEGILFVAAAGNGNLLGNGVNNDATPFYPASYQAENVIAVASLSGAGDALDPSSNFGSLSVDLAAPGTSVCSTFPGGRFGVLNGTSMAAPHVSGAAALVWSALPAASLDEVKSALLTTTVPLAIGGQRLATGGRLDVAAAIDADVFAPSAQLVAKADISESGGAGTQFVIRYSHREGIDINHALAAEVVVTRQWGPADVDTPVPLQAISIDGGSQVDVTYSLDAPGGTWDALDFGDYLISTVSGSLQSPQTGQPIEQRDVGSFNVRITDDPSLLYVDQQSDSITGDSLRTAINSANVSGQPRTIILDSGQFTLDIPHRPDPTSTFTNSDPRLFCGASDNQTGWSGPLTGDFDVTGEITILGNQSDVTIIDGNNLDRLFKVHEGASLDLQRVTLTGGASPVDQGGGGILSRGDLTLQDVVVRDNVAMSSSALNPIRGGGLAIWDGTADIRRSWFDENSADFGGGIFVCGPADATITQSTLSNNQGGGLHSHSDQDVLVENSTFSSNSGGLGAIFNGKRDGRGISNGLSQGLGLSSNDRFVIFESTANNLVKEDANARLTSYVFDRLTSTLEPIRGIDNYRTRQASISNDGNIVTFVTHNSELFVQNRTTNESKFISQTELGRVSPNGQIVVYSEGNSVKLYDRSEDRFETILESSAPVFAGDISDDGNWIALVSRSPDIVANDTNGLSDVFLYNRANASIQRISTGLAGEEANGHSGLGGRMSPDGRLILIRSSASNLVPDDTNNENDPFLEDLFLFDRIDQTIRRINIDQKGGETTGTEIYGGSVSHDGRYVTYFSDADSIIDGDNDSLLDGFRFDLQDGSVEQLALEPFVDDAFAIFNSIVLTRDATHAVLQRTGDDVIPGDNNRRSDIFLLELASGSLISPTIPDPTTSTLVARQVTINDTIGHQFAVSGVVRLEDALLAGHVNDLDVRTDSSANIVLSSDAGSNLLGPLTAATQSAPVHPLLQGNPAIDAGSSEFIGTFDQRGRLRTVPDIGAFEVFFGSAQATVFVDLNENQLLDPGEPGLSGVTVSAHSSLTAEETFQAVSRSDDPLTLEDETGKVAFTELDPDDFTFDVRLPENFELALPKLIQLQPPSLQPSTLSFSPVLNDDGTLVAFTSDGFGDILGDSDIFTFDRLTGEYQLVSGNASGTSTHAFAGWNTMTGDGQLIAYTSGENDQFPQGNQNEVVFLFSRASEQTRLIGTAINGPKTQLEISDDGRFVTFNAFNKQLDRLYLANVEQDVSVEVADQVTSNGALSTDGRFVVFASESAALGIANPTRAAHLYVFDQQDSSITPETPPMPQGSDGLRGVGSSISLNRDGRFVAFSSDAPNLITSDSNGVADIFVKDLESGTFELISVGTGQAPANGASAEPSISSDGRFVVFQSEASNLIAGDDNDTSDVFVFDRLEQTMALVNKDADGQAFEFGGFAPSISGDGRWIGFSSSQNTLSGNRQTLDSVFLVPNPLIENVISRRIEVADQINDIELGLIPDPGQIRGRLFEEQVSNGVFDLGEATLADWTVFLDENSNGSLDNGEQFAHTDLQGQYSFEQLPSFRSYSVVVTIPPGWQQVVPEASEGLARNIFLPAGGDIAGRDFAFQRVTGTGQSNNSSVSGRVYQDRNGNHSFDPGIDVPLPDIAVYVDRQDPGTHNTNEPIENTDAQGIFTIAPLSAGIAVVRPELEFTSALQNTAGNSFGRNRFPLFEDLQPYRRPQSIVTGNFNHPDFVDSSFPADFPTDDLPDVAVALQEGNLIAIRLNDGQGGFGQREINIELGTNGGGPTSLVVGHFDGDQIPDIAVTNYLTSNVMVLTGFDGTDFSSKTVIPTGQQTIDLVAAPISGNENFLDLVVVNQFDNTLQLLSNVEGTFQPQPPIPTAGQSPSSIVSSDFNGDGHLDVAVAHAAPLTTTGDVTIFLNDSGGNFVKDVAYPVQAAPSDLTVGDFNGDGREDLAVSNAASNSISILTGLADGKFTVAAAPLGTAKAAIDIATADLDNDGDIDIVASNLADRNVSIFRNVTPAPSATDPSPIPRFEPLESVGVGEFGFQPRMPIALANFDGDTNGPNGEGTVDILALPDGEIRLQLTVLTNTLINGGHRVAFDGMSAIDGLDFIVAPSRLLPAFAPFDGPIATLEDAGPVDVALTSVTAGRSSNRLRLVATSSQPTLIPDPIPIDSPLEFNDPRGGIVTFPFAAVENSNDATVAGNQPAVITVRVIDPGADQLFDTPDDTTAEQTLTVTVEPVNDPPQFELPLNDVVTVVKDSGTLIVPEFVTGIGPGGGIDESSQSLVGFNLSTSSDLFSNGPTIDPQGELQFTPKPGVTGTAVVHVTLSDTGGRNNQGIDTAQSAFAIAILEPNPTAIILEGSGNTFFLTQAAAQPDAIQLIDIRGSGDNTLMLDANRIATTFPDGRLTVVADAGDAVVFDDGWQFVASSRGDEQLIRQFSNGPAELNLVGPDDFANPIDPFDVNANGEVTALDALQVINELSRRIVSDGNSNPIGQVRDLDLLDLTSFRFYDVSADHRITALDALRVINELARRDAFRAAGEARSSARPTENMSALQPRLVDAVLADLPGR